MGPIVAAQCDTIPNTNKEYFTTMIVLLAPYELNQDLQMQKFIGYT